METIEPQRIHNLVNNGVEVVRVTVLETSGSTPRHSGSAMFVAGNGELLGTIGGGRIEYVAIDEARKLFGGDVYEKTCHYSLTMDGKDSLGMVCGGEATVLLELFARTHPYTPVETQDTPGSLFIFGAGHVGRALEPIARSVGFHVTIVDDRAEFADASLYPHAEAVHVVESYTRAFDPVETDDSSYIVIVTSGHSGDYDVLKLALQRPHAYIGMIGSKRKCAALFKWLAEEGFSQEQIDSVHAPIGEQIYAETPAEIAISITAELIRVRATRR